MKQFFDSFEDDFLKPSEDNFPDLLAKLSRLHSHIAGQSPQNVPRVPLADRYSYDTLAFRVPQKGRDSHTVLAKLADAFQGSIRWHQPSALMNITPNPLLDSVAASTMAALYNTNAAWDYPSGNVIKFEKEVTAFLCHLAGWDARQAEGISTSGGKATLHYAIRCGLNVCDRQSVAEGLHGSYVVIASATAHYSLEDLCNYTGIGRANLLRVATDATGAMLPKAFEQTLRSAVVAGKKVAAIIALGGDTLEHAIDPIKTIRRIRDKVTDEYQLGYKPYLHLDSVNAWIGLVFRQYDFAANPLHIDTGPLAKIRTLSERISQVAYADSFSADFHKTGLAPYISSFFITKKGSHLHSINKSTLQNTPSYRYGEVHTHHASFENSRSSGGILAAWTSIHRLGIEGYQRYWAQLLTAGEYMRQRIRQDYAHEMKIVNPTALGHPIVIQPLPPDSTRPFKSPQADSPALERYSAYCFELYDYMAYRLLGQDKAYPLLGFIPSYKYEITGIRRPAFLLYSNHPHLTAGDCDALLERITAMKHEFEAQRTSSPKQRTNRLRHLPK